jgi:GNAT superfamily N-acetyltransferase
MPSPIQIRPMTENDIDLIYTGLSGHDISKPHDYVKRCWAENQRIERVTLLLFYNVEFVGWGHVIYKPLYPYFAENGIPEIQNFDVIPPFRKRGIGSILIEGLEEIAFNKSNTIDGERIINTLKKLRDIGNTIIVESSTNFWRMNDS